MISNPKLKASFKQTKQKEILRPSGIANDYFGHSLCLSRDGKTMATSSTYTNGIQVFIRSGFTWTLQATLTTTGADTQGDGLAISKDGNTLLVGLMQATVSATSQGTAAVFTRSGSTWSLQATLVHSAPALGDYFGVDVSLSNDGNTAAVGAFADNVGAATDAGSVTVFTRSGSTWSQQQYITEATPVINRFFGRRSALSGDGNTLAVTGRDGSVNDAFIYTRSASTWSLQATITISGQGGIYGSPSLSENGNTLAVPLPSGTASVSTQGKVNIYTRSGSTWTLQATLVHPTPAASDAFGIKSAFNSSGTEIFIGALLDDVGAHSDQGSVTQYRLVGSTWTYKALFVKTATANTPVTFTEPGMFPPFFTPTTRQGQYSANFGTGIALSGDGKTLMVSAPRAAILESSATKLRQGSITYFYQ